MKIPKRIQKLIDKKYKLAMELSSISREIDDWLESKGANLLDDDIEDCVNTGCSVYCDPGSARKSVVNYIENKI